MLPWEEEALKKLRKQKEEPDFVPLFLPLPEPIPAPAEERTPVPEERGVWEISLL